MLKHNEFEFRKDNSFISDFTKSEKFDALLRDFGTSRDRCKNVWALYNTLIKTMKLERFKVNEDYIKKEHEYYHITHNVNFENKPLSNVWQYDINGAFIAPLINANSPLEVKRQHKFVYMTLKKHDKLLPLIFVGWQKRQGYNDLPISVYNYVYNQIQEICNKINELGYHVYKTYVDSVATNMPPDEAKHIFCIGDKLGDLKIEDDESFGYMLNAGCYMYYNKKTKKIKYKNGSSKSQDIHCNVFVCMYNELVKEFKID